MKFIFLIVALVSITNAAFSEDYISEHAKKVFDEDHRSFNESEIVKNFDDDYDGRPKANLKFFQIKTKKECLDKSTMYQIGYYNNGERDVFESCHNSITHENHYVHYELKKPDKKPSGTSSTDWREDNFPVNDIDFLYKRRVQFCTIGRLIEDLKIAGEWIKENGEYYLSRGHLAAQSDFPASEELKRESTFTFFNAAPQFQIFNGGNWALVEERIQDLARSHGDLEIYSGTYGNVILNSKTIYLGHQTVPVPMLFYKMAMNSKKDKGIVLIGVNDPYLEKIETHHIICNDVANQFKWENIKNRKNIRKGYIYACRVNDFIKKVKILDKENAPYELLT